MRACEGDITSEEAGSVGKGRRQSLEISSVRKRVVVVADDVWRLRCGEER